jgi:hypothetical protein
MAHHVIDRRADGAGETPVVERRGYGFLHLDHVFVAQVVQFVGGDARLNKGLNEIKQIASRAAGATHGVLFGRGLDGKFHEWLMALAEGRRCIGARCGLLPVLADNLRA